MSTERLARSECSRRLSHRGWPGSRTPIRSRWTSTNGDRCPTTQDFCWSATATGIEILLPLQPPICVGNHAGLRPLPVALRPWPRSVAVLQGAQDLVHPEDLRDREAWRRYHEVLCAGPLS